MISTSLGTIPACEAAYSLADLLLAGSLSGMIGGSLGALFAALIRAGSDRTHIAAAEPDLSGMTEALPPADVDRILRSSLARVPFHRWVATRSRWVPDEPVPHRRA